MSGRKRGATLLQRFEEKFAAVPSGCWEWTASTNQRAGYSQFRVGGRMVYGHRVSWEIYKGPIPGELHVLHRCDNRLCVNPEHLFLGTNIDNVADMVAKSRQPKGESHGRSKLTGGQIAEIRALGGKMLQREIANLFGIRQQQVSHILRGIHWDDLDTIQRECAEQGIRLTDPGPDLNTYHARYRTKEAA